MSDIKRYARCATHCNYETMTKDEILEAIASGGKTCFVRGTYNDDNLGSILYEYNGVDPQTLAVSGGNALTAAISLIIDSADAETAPALGSSSWITVFKAAADCTFKVWIYGKESLVTNCRIVNSKKVKDGLFIYVSNERILEYTASSSNLIKLVNSNIISDHILAKKMYAGSGYHKIEVGKFYKVLSPAPASLVYVVNLPTGTKLTTNIGESLGTSSEIYIESFNKSGSDISVTYSVNGESKTRAAYSSDEGNLCISISNGGVIYEYKTEMDLLGDFTNEALIKRISNVEGELAKIVTDIRVIKDTTFDNYHSFAAKCIELDTAEEKAAYIGLISITTKRGSSVTTNKYYCLGLVKYYKRNNTDPVRTVTIISSNGEIMVSDGAEYSPISTPADPVYNNDIVNLAYVKTLENRLAELENKVAALTGTTATVEGETLVLKNATVEGDTLVVRGATVEDDTLII